MSKFLAVFQAIFTAEESIVPLFVHNPKSQKIAAVVLTAESAVPGVVQEIQSLFNPPKATP